MSPPRGSGGGPRHAPSERKTRQLCSQVRRALDLVLGESLDDVLEDVAVDAVQPTADPGRLLVVFAVGERALDAGRADIAARLEALRPRFVDEVASTIHRRKVPELGFEIVRAPDPDDVPGADA